MKNIFVDAHIFDGKPQGTVTYLKGLYNNLIPVAIEKFHFYIAAQNVDVLRQIFGDQPNVTFVQLRFSNKFVRLIFEIPMLIRKYKIDYAHYQYISPFLKFCREIITIHDILFLDYKSYFPKAYYLKNKFLFSRSAHRADLLLTVSSYSRDAISRHYGIPLSDIYITPNGITYNQNEKADLLPDVKSKYGLGNYLLYVSRFEPRKNQIILLKAFVELKLYEQGYDLVFIGNKDLDIAEYTVYSEGLPKNVKSHILTYTNIDDAELAAFYRNCTLFVFPSFAEGFGIPPLEAYVYGCNSLCSDSTAMKDFDFLTDSFFDPNNLDQLKDLISKRLELPLRPTSEQQAEVAERYSWRHIAEDYLNLLLKMDK